MFQVIGPLSKFWKRKQVSIYDTVFSLHSKFTVCILVGCTLFLSANQYFGSNIDCFESSGKFKTQVDTFCWMTGTFISKKHLNGTIGRNMISYGMSMANIPEHQRNYQKYYQWVPICLTIQALSLYLPAFLWKCWEKNTLHRLIGDLSQQFFVNANTDEGRMTAVYNFFLHRHYHISHNIYAIRYFVAELLNVGVVIGNIMLLNVFLRGFWWEFWPAMTILLNFDYHNWLMESSRVFPRIARCEFFYSGPTGTIQNLDTLCLLPLNVLNEKIYAFIYMWLLILFVISAVNILYKFLLLICRPLRMILVRIWYREVPAFQWETILDHGQYGQWFLFCRIGENLSTNVLCQLADQLYHTQREEYYLK